MTLHKLLYDSIPKPNGGFLRIKKTSLEYQIVVIDEVSMVPKSMIELLMSHKIYILFLGDPFQLPQINKEDSHDLLDHPHIFLDEIVRQAAESEIVQLSMKIRNNEPIPFSHGKETIVIPKKEFVTGHLTWADQVICATNSTRKSLNDQMRSLLGFSGALPQHGEKMICLRNYWNDLDENGETALVNGTTGIIQNPFESFRMAPPYVRMRNHKIDNVTCDFVAEDGKTYKSVEMDKGMLLTGEYSLDWKESFALGKLIHKIGDIQPRQFTFGYAITCWKAQGSEWDKVVIIEEPFPFNKVEHAKFLYTGVTRASEKLVLVR